MNRPGKPLFLTMLCTMLCPLLLAAVFLVGCGGTPAASADLANSTPTDAATPPDLAIGGPFAVACTDTIDAVYTAPAGLPPFDSTHRGDVVRCAFDRMLSVDQLKGVLATAGSKVSTPKSAVNVYRIAYRTQRLVAGKVSDGLSSALVLLPTQKSSGPLVVSGHGTVGMAASCAPSTHDLLGHDDWDDSRVLNLGLAAGGYMVIAPDYAGFGFGSTNGWSLSEDEAHSLLDATRAMKQLLPSGTPDKVVIAGHSQGGHAVLSAQALAGSYGLNGTLVGVVAFAPLWLSSRTWGAALFKLASLNTTDNPGPLVFSLHYFYGHGENYDGPGGGLTMFRPEKKQQVQTMLTTLCLGDLEKNIAQLGMVPSDFYDPNFCADVGACGALLSCGDEPAKTWEKRFSVDRPAMDGAGAPVLVWQGAMDSTIDPTRAQCGFDKLHADLKAAKTPTASLTLCEDATATHGGVVRQDMDFVNQWIAARAGLGADPAACPSWTTRTCATPPPNQD